VSADTGAAGPRRRDTAGDGLEAGIAAAAAEARRPLGREEVSEIVASVLQGMEGDVSSVDLKLYAELEALARYIQHAREEIAEIRPDDLTTRHIPRATDELDAVVGATEEATNRIMDACDEIQQVAGGLDGAQAAALTGAVTRIFEACNFQDVTGQRITKVVQTLRHIEQRIEGLVEALGGEISAGRDDAMPAQPAGGSEDRFLLNGPQLPGKGIDQSEIDRLLASFD
jgi:chemotaxis protein CheZ